MATALANCSMDCPAPVANDGAWHPDEERDLCARHRQLWRLREGRCPNCGSAMRDRPIINSITNQPRVSAGVPVTERACTSPSCGYVLRSQHGHKARRGHRA